MTRARLPADIGGSNSRIAWQAGPTQPSTDVLVLPSAAHAGLVAAIAAYLRRIGRTAPPDRAVAIATSVQGDLVAMTNHPWQFSNRALRTRCGFERLPVLNDYTALAPALPALLCAARAPDG